MNNIKEIFVDVLDTFENDDIKQYAVARLKNVAPYWWTTPASSSGKYHPTISLGDGGLVRHTVAVMRFMNYFFKIDSIANQFTTRERDLMRVAALCHDMMKSGSQVDYDKNKHTKFDHPILEANDIRNSRGLPNNEIELIAHCIESHMGQWNTDKRYPDVTLPTPQDKYQIFVHLADYMASRKDLTMEFDEKYLPKLGPEELPDINTWKIPFGKFSGKTLPEIAKEAPWYIKWAKENLKAEPAKSLIQNFDIESYNVNTAEAY